MLGLGSKHHPGLTQRVGCGGTVSVGEGFPERAALSGLLQEERSSSLLGIWRRCPTHPLLVCLLAEVAVLALPLLVLQPQWPGA